MSLPVNINGVIIPYPQTGDTGWGDDATKFAVEVASVLGKIGQSQAPVNDDIIVSPGNLSVTSGNLSVGGDASVTGNTTLTGNETVGGTLDVTGATTLSSTLGVTGDVAINTNKFNITASSGNTTIAGALGVTGNTTIDGVTYLDDDTTANTPVLSFTGDTNTGIGRSAADTLDFITNGNSRFRIEPTGQIKAVYESQVGTDYNTTLHNGYLCRGWVNFNGTGTVAIRASGNVTSITDNGTGDYTVNFTTAMPDSDYSCSFGGGGGASNVDTFLQEAYGALQLKTTSQVRILSSSLTGALGDRSIISVVVFR